MKIKIWAFSGRSEDLMDFREVEFHYIVYNVLCEIHQYQFQNNSK